MNNIGTLAAILLAMWTGSAAAQSAIGGPKKQSEIGGPTAQKNPVVRPAQGGASTLPPSPPKPSKK